VKDERITKVVVDVIKERNPNWWKHSRGNSHTDDAGNGIYVHEDSIVWESTDWVDYDVLDLINDRLERLHPDLFVAVEYGNSYEVLIEEL
jgi:hypothetical protein